MLCLQALFVTVVVLGDRGSADAGSNEISVEDKGNGIAGPARKMPSFQDFVEIHNRDYTSDPSEFARRKALYEARVLAATKHNSNEDRLWTAHPNRHWDRDEYELKALSGWLRMDIGGLGHAPSSLMQAELGTEPKDQTVFRVDDLPAEHSWIELAAMKPDRIRNQVCGNCWAAATTAMLESHMELHMGWQDARVPEMEITHCSANPFQCGGSGGCGGSTPELALQHTMVNGLKGLVTSNGYGGNASAMNELSMSADIDGKFDTKSNCPESIRDIVNVKEPAPHEAISGVRKTPEGSPAKSFGMLGWERLPENRHEPIMRALVERGPAAVAVSTDWSMGGLSLAQYSSGIFDGCHKDASISHSVLAIGYGSAKHRAKDETAKYWLLQNSWGSSFGENGHFRLLRTENSGDNCGTDKEPLLGVGCEGGESAVRVCGMCGIIYDTVLPHFEARTERSKQMLSMRVAKQVSPTDSEPMTTGGSGFTESQAQTNSTNLSDINHIEKMTSDKNYKQFEDASVKRHLENAVVDELNRFRLRAKRDLHSASKSLQAS